MASYLTQNMEKVKQFYYFMLKTNHHFKCNS